MTSRLILLLAVATGIEAAEDPWRYVDPGSKLIMGVQMRRILDSRIGGRLRQQLRDAVPSIPRLPGIGSLSNIDTVLFASPGAPGNKPGTPGPMLVVVSGQFDLPKVRAGLNQKSRRVVVQNIEIFESADRSAGRMAIALVSPDLLLMGDTPLIVRSIGTLPAIATSLLVQARQMNEDYQFWMVSSIPPEAVTGQSPIPFPMPPVDIRGMEMGIAFADDFALEMGLRMASPDDVETAKAQFAKVIQLAGKDRNNPEWTHLDRYMKLTAEQDTLRIVFRMEAADIEQRMRVYQARRKSVPAPAVAAAPPPRSTNSKPVIWNNDQ